MGVLTDLMFRVGHAMRARPRVRIVVGGLVIIAGAIGVFFGAGHGGLIAFGLLVFVGGATAIRGNRARVRDDAERDQRLNESGSDQPEVPQ
jgi:hypothetical protein